MTRSKHAQQGRPLGKLANLLPSPLRPLYGKRSEMLPLPDNIVCFARHAAHDLNNPQRGRALHHRFVLIFALKTGATVRVDDRDMHLSAGEGLVVFPFQFHDYANHENEDINWLFITFDFADESRLSQLRYCPFAVTPDMEQIAVELVSGYLRAGHAELTTLLLALLLLQIRDTACTGGRTPDAPAPAVSAALTTQINRISQSPGQAPNVKEVAASLGISASHLRARFRESCGVSLGKHLRRQRLEKACGLLRLSDLRVSEIADLSGFTSIYSFCRAFHSAYGLSPLEYRKGERKAA